MTIGDIVGEGIDIHHLAENEKDRHDKIIALLERVGLNSEHANRYCHEFSGGSASARGHCPCTGCEPPSSSFVTSLFPHWTFPFRHRSSICSRICSRRWV